MASWPYYGNTEMTMYIMRCFTCAVWLVEIAGNYFPFISVFTETAELTMQASQ